MASRNYLNKSQVPGAAANAQPVQPPPQPKLNSGSSGYSAQQATYSEPLKLNYGSSGYSQQQATYSQPLKLNSGSSGYAQQQTPYRAPAPTYYQAPQTYQQPYQPPVQNFAPAPPPEPPRPQFAPGGRQEFLNIFSPEQRQLSEQEWLGGDSDYTAQTGLYQRALDDFVKRITGRIQGFETDATEALAGNKKNETMSADQLGADFGARGLSYSGLFDTSKNKLLDRYKQGRTNIEKNKTQNVQNANDERQNYESENAISQQNAKRASLMRMAAQQSLKDVNY